MLCLNLKTKLCSLVSLFSLVISSNKLVIYFSQIWSLQYNKICLVALVTTMHSDSWCFIRDWLGCTAKHTGRWGHGTFDNGGRLVGFMARRRTSDTLHHRFWCHLWNVLSWVMGEGGWNLSWGDSASRPTCVWIWFILSFNADWISILE